MSFNTETARKAGKIGRNNARNNSLENLKLINIFRQMFTITDNQGRTTIDLIFKNLLDNAIKGDVKSIEVLLNMYNKQLEKEMNKKLFSMLQKNLKKIVKAMENKEVKEVKN